MWLVALPMGVVVCMTTVLLFAQDFLVDRLREQGQVIGRSMVAQHIAAVRYCTRYRTQCPNGARVGLAKFGNNMSDAQKDAPIFHDNDGYFKSYFIGDAVNNKIGVVTYLSKNDFKGNMPLGAVARGVFAAGGGNDLQGAGIYNQDDRSVLGMDGKKRYPNLPGKSPDNGTPMIIEAKNDKTTK